MPTSRVAAAGTRLALALLLAAACAAASAAQGSDEWVKVEPPGEGFSVMMPPEPVAATEEVPMLGNKYRMSSHTTLTADGLVYVMALQDLPTLVTALPPRERLDRFMDGVREGFAGKAGPDAVALTLVSEHDLKGHAGRTYAFTFAETRGMLRAYDGGRRVYLLMVFGAKEGDANAARFLNSFDLKAEAAPPPPKPKPTPRAAARTIQADPMLFPPDTRPLPYGDPKRPPEPPGGGGPGNTAPVDYERPFGVRDVTKKAVLQARPEPMYTEEARKNNVSGTVRLRMVLGKDGRVSNISVVRGLPDGLTQQAIAAARRIEFIPARKDGRDVSQWVTVDYNFNIFDYEESDPAVTAKAVILERPEPAYTDEARREKTEGTVVLRVFLWADGRASTASVVRGLPHGLTERAVEAAGRIRFKPAEAAGRPVSVVRLVEYVFVLK